MTIDPLGPTSGPVEPDWAAILTDELAQQTAKSYWAEIVAEMREAGTLAPANGHAIRRLVLFRIEFDESARLIGETGKILRAKKTAVPQISPQWTCMKQANEAAQSLEAELGLMPRRRSAAGKVQRGKRRETAADKYLGNVTKLRPDHKVG